MEKAIRNLKGAGLLDPRSLASAKPSIIEPLIRPTGFYRQKARRILEFSRRLVDNGAKARLVEKLLRKDSPAKKATRRVLGRLAPKMKHSLAILRLLA